MKRGRKKESVTISTKFGSFTGNFAYLHMDNLINSYCRYKTQPRILDLVSLFTLLFASFASIFVVVDKNRIFRTEFFDNLS